LIIDLGDTKSEKRSPGLAYVAVSRGNSTGKGNNMNSAIYFIGKNTTLKRLTGMTMKDGGKNKCVLCARRDHWIAYLKKRSHWLQSDVEKKQNSIIQWAKEYRIDRQHFEENVCNWGD